MNAQGQQAKGPLDTVFRPALAIGLLVIIVIVVMSFFGGYRTNGDEPVTETIQSEDATETPEPEAEESDQEEAAPEESTGATVIVLIEGLNFRKEPSRSGELIRGLDEGVSLKHVETADGWYKVEDSDGTVGYVSASSQYTDLKE